MKRIRIAGICGSLTANSHTKQALGISLEEAKNAGAETSLIDLRNYQIPMLNSPFEYPKSKQHLSELVKILKKADGIIVATPEYHGSFSGALKNLLDWMGFDEFEGKMIGLIGVAGGSMGAINALNHMGVVFRQLHAWVVPQQVSIANSKDVFDKNGNLKDPQIQKRLKQLGVEVARFALLHDFKRWKDFVKMWEKSVQNPGGEDR